MAVPIPIEETYPTTRQYQVSTKQKSYGSCYGHGSFHCSQKCGSIHGHGSFHSSQIPGLCSGCSYIYTYKRAARLHLLFPLHLKASKRFCVFCLTLNTGYSYTNMADESNTKGIGATCLKQELGSYTNMADESTTKPLLKKHYYENCPGCKVDQAKVANRGLPIRHLFSIWMVVLCTTMPTTSLFPYIYFMVRDFKIAKREEDIGSYAGYVGSAFMLGRSLTSVLWGMVSDRYGRKPVIIVGALSVVVFNTLFGLSTSFWMAVSMRFLLGSFNGSLGPAKAYACEIFREEHQALGLSTVSAAWGIGLVFGSSLGGYLAQPVEKYPQIFPKNSFWDQFPYFLPCFIISAFALAVTIGCLWLPETLHNHNGSDACTDDLEAIKNGSSEDNKDKITKKDENLLLNWPLMSSIIVYCVFSLHDIAFQEVFSLWAVSPRRLGGLNFTTDEVGNVLAISGGSLIIYQFLYPFVERVCGPITTTRISAGLSIPLLQSFPYIAMLSGFPLKLVLNVASIAKNTLSETILTGLFILQNKAVEQHQRGAANGISITGMSIFKAIGPAGGGAVLTWSQKRMDASFLPGPHMVFLVLNLVEALGLLMMFKPFLGERKKKPSEQLH